MPSITDKPSIAAAQILGKQLVDGSANLTIAQLKDAYTGFRGALATPELKAEMDKFLTHADPQLAGLIGADKANAQAELKGKTDAVWGKFFSREDAKLELFTAVFGAAKVAEVPDGWKHLIEGRFEKEEGGKLIYNLNMSKPGPPDPRGFDVLITHGVASGKIAVDPKDMSWTVVGGQPAAVAATPDKAPVLDNAALKSAVWAKHFAKDSDREALFVAVFGKALIDQVPPRWRHLLGTGVDEFKDGKLIMPLNVSVKDEDAKTGGFDVLITKTLGEARVEFGQDLSWKKL